VRVTTEDDIIRKADEILSRADKDRPGVDTGKFHGVRVPRRATDTHEVLQKREQMSSSYGHGEPAPETPPDKSDRRVTNPYAANEVEAIKLKVEAARRVLLQAFDAIKKSGLPPPEWAERVLTLLNRAVRTEGEDE